MQAKKPKPAAKPAQMETVSLRFRVEQIQRLEAMARDKGTTRSALIQIAVARLLKVGLQ